ncbi:MAG TPA: hypothetical protein VNI20_08180 [Fimbriimonadaceae bacterium]|nr:hypothetical protein [Fimbriimonadaceae bacterium]
MRAAYWTGWSVLGLLFAWGCAGGSGSSGADTSKSLGEIQIDAVFAPATRIIPGYADTVEVAVTPPNGVDLPIGTPQTFNLTRTSASMLMQNLQPSSAPYRIVARAVTSGTVVGSTTRSAFVTANSHVVIDVSANLQTAVSDIVIEGPSTVSSTDTTVQFTAHARDANGLTLFSGSGFEWTSSAGQILYVDVDTGLAIPLKLGTSKITARLKGTTLTDSLDVTVESSTTVGVSPSSVTLAPGQLQEFKASVAGGGSVLWGIDESNGGKINGNGLYIAPAVSGTYHVRATSINDPAVSETATVVVSGGGSGQTVVLHPAGADRSAVNAIWNGKAVGFVSQSLIPAPAVWPGTTPTWTDYSAKIGGSGQILGANGSSIVGQTASGTPFLYIEPPGTKVDLSASGSLAGTVNAVAGNVQVGSSTFSSGTVSMLWSGSAASAVNLNPSGATSSVAYGTDGSQQVGSAVFGAIGRRAGLWFGNSASWIDLTPLDSTGASEARGVSNGVEVGYATFGNTVEAGRWSGTASSWVNMHPLVAGGSMALAIEGQDVVGWFDFDSSGQSAVIWVGPFDSTSKIIDLQVFLPAMYKSSIATCIGHSGSTTYIGGIAYTSPSDPGQAVLWISG